MDSIGKITRKTLLNEVAGISFIVRSWADILEKEVNEKLKSHRESHTEKQELPKTSTSTQTSANDDPFYWEDEYGSGYGGSYKNDFIEVHGENYEQVAKFLDSKKIAFKKIGG